jgi:hypothetical protein
MVAMPSAAPLPLAPGARASLAVFLAMSLGTSSPVRAAPAGDLPAGVETTYQEGITERDAGNFVAAAESFTAAYKDIPAKSRAIRASVLFDLVDARRQAFAEGENAGQICECERLLVDYVAEVKQTFGSKGDKYPDTRKAKKLLTEVRQQIAALRAETPTLDCATTTVERPPEPTPEPEPTPPPVVEPQGPSEAELQAEAAHKRRARTLVIAGAVTTGVGGLFLGLMAGGLVIGRKAESDGAARTQMALDAGTPLSESDPKLQDIVARGKLGNRLAIAGGVLATVAVAAGVSLLVLGLRKPARATRAALTPTLAPGYAGAGFTLQF